MKYLLAPLRAVMAAAILPPVHDSAADIVIFFCNKYISGKSVSIQFFIESSLKMSVFPDYLWDVRITELPLDGNAIDDVFKVYMKDCGLFISMLEDGTQYDILQGKLYGYKGAIFENLIADIFSKMGRKLYYYHKDSGLEIDFVMRYKGECTLVEVKATNGNTKSTRTILNHPEKYHVKSAIKLGDYNVGNENQILTLPLYMAFLLDKI